MNAQAPDVEAVEIPLTVVEPGLYGRVACQAGDVITVDDKKRAKQLIERGHCKAGGDPNAKKKAKKKPADKGSSKKPSGGEGDDDKKPDGDEPNGDDDKKPAGRKPPEPKK